MELLKETMERYGQGCRYSEVFTESGETIVPDVNPDAMNITNTEAVLCIKEKTVMAGCVKLTGEIQTEIYYQAYEGNELYTISTKMPFVHLCQMDCKEDDLAVAEIRLVQADSELRNPRKLGCTAEIALGIRIYRRDQQQYLREIAGNPEERLQVRCRQREEWVVAGISQKRITAAEELKLPAGEYGEDVRILEWKSDWVTEEAKVLSKKVVVRGNVKLDVLFLSGDSKVTRGSYTVPFSQILECEETEPGDKPELQYLVQNEQLRLSGKPEGGLVLACDLTAELTVLAHRWLRHRVVEDVYSTAFEMALEHCELPRAEIDRCTTQVSEVNEVLPAVGVPVRIHHTRVNPCCAAVEQGAKTVCAGYRITVLYETSEGQLCAAHKEAEARLELEQPAACGFLLCPGAEAVTAAIQTDGTISVSFRATVRIPVWEEQPCTCVCSCKLDAAARRQGRRKGTLVLRNVSGGEDVWAIAKSYNTTAAAIRSANKLTEEQEPELGRLLIIPFVE